MNNFFDFSKYVFIFAHPDDEIYTCLYIAEISKKGKDVNLIYVTSGDYSGPEFGAIRENEVFKSMDFLGMSKEKVQFLRVPERELMKKVPEVQRQIVEIVEEIDLDCIVSHEFEGGHNGHDAVSLCAYITSKHLDKPIYTFPAYHGWPEKRVWNQFAKGEPTDTLTLTDEQRDLQNKVIDAHKTQKSFFDAIKQSDSYKLLSAREILKRIDRPLDYTNPPTDPVGYEYPGSKIKFEDFKSVAEEINS